MRRLLLLAFIWGWSFLFIKVAVEGMTPTTVAFLRIFLGALVLRLWLRWRRVPGLGDPGLRRWATLVGLVGSAVPFTMLAWGEQRISSALTAVLNASTPLFTAVAASALVGEKLRAPQIAGLLVGLGGVSVAAGVGAADLTGSSLAGGAASVAAGAFYGLAFALMRAHLTGVPPAVAAAGQLTAGAALLAPFALVTSLTDGFDPTWRRIGAILVLGVVGTGLAYLLNYRIVADLGPTRASLVTYVIPLVAVVVGAVVLDERFERRVLVGGVLIIAGISLVNGLARLPRRPPVAAAGVVLVIAAAAGMVGCGDGGGGGSGACGPDRREALDPSSANHVLPGGGEPEYLTDPPTSGPHEPGTVLSGVLDEPLSRAAQVGSLEGGGVLLQHRDLTAEELAELESLAGASIAVVPNPDLPERVVATAWLFKQTCTDVDVDALRAFAEDHRGKALVEMADAWGIEDGYEDVRGEWHVTPDATRRALRSAMGGHADVDDPPPQSRPVWFVRHGQGPSVQRPADVELEDGTHVAVTAALPPDLPLGYHDLHPSDGGPTTRLIVVPDRCAPAPTRAWGLAAQLYAARSSDSWGIGDLGDLATIGRWATSVGAGFVVLSPLHAPLPGPTPEASPYFASSRRWRNPLHLRIEDVGGFDPDDDVLADLVAAGRRLDLDRLIDRASVWACKRAALDHIWKRTDPGTDPAFRRWRAAAGAPLVRYATFCALAEHHGGGWPAWPSEHRRPDAPAVVRFAAEQADAVSFHAWVQWLLDRQLELAAAASPGLVHDLAIGADPHGFDAWAWQDVLANGVRVGAPPDEFNTAGQDWGLPPFVPWRLRAAGYEPLAELLRGAFEHGAGLRVDHVMGLFRLWWIPEGEDAAAGGYVRFPGHELLDVLALESARAGAYVVGEDLGTVEDAVREAMAERDVLSYRLAWFEPEPPERWPERALAALTTHDLPTLAGVASGVDDEDGELSGRLKKFLDAPIPDDAVDLAECAHQRLAASPCRLVAATLDDALGAVDRPNQPGTTSDERPNWSIPLPVSIDELPTHPGAAAVVEAFRGGQG